MTVNNIVVFLYLAIILIIGIYNRVGKDNFSAYAKVRGRAKYSKLLLVATIFATSVGGATTFGLTEKAFSGYTYYGYALILLIPIDILIAIYIVPRIIDHYGAESIGDIMFKYYGLAGRYIAGISSVIVSIGFVAAQISVSGYIFQYILKINYIEGVILSYSVVIIYTTIGGLQSIIFTNLLQFFAMIIAIPIITIFGLREIGYDNFVYNLSPEKIYFSHNFANIIAAMLNFSVMNLYPTFIQRALINKHSGETSKAIYIKSVIYIIFIICVILNGLIAYDLFPDQNSNLALPYLIDRIIPSFLQGIVIVGLIAAVMSTADSDLNVTSITLIKDLLSPIFKVHNQHKLLFIARIANITIGSLAIIIALKFNNVIDLVVFITGFWGPMILVSLVFALFNVTISKKMMIFSGGAGVFSFLSWEYYRFDYFHLKGVFIGTIVNLVIFCLGLVVKKRINRHR